MSSKVAIFGLCFLLNTPDVHARHETSPPHPEQSQNLEEAHPSNVCRNDEGTCVLPVQCPAHFYSESVSPPIKECKLRNDRRGICCRTGRDHAGSVLRQRSFDAIALDETTGTILRQAVHDGRARASMLKLREAGLLAARDPPIMATGSPSYGHFRTRRVRLDDLPDVFGLADKAFEIALATRAFKERRGISNRDLEWDSISHGSKDGLPPPPLKFSCPTSSTTMTRRCLRIEAKYRVIDGTCNNLKSPRWGAQLTAFSRLLPPSYEDGIFLPRLSKKTHRPLPSPRLISTTLFPELDNPDYDYTTILSYYGQFLSHDITFSMDMTFANGEAVFCCTKDGTEILPPKRLHHFCMPIEVPEDDPFFGKYGVRCMNFVRSMLAPGRDCALGYAQQLNKITHFIDASPVYGSNSKELGDLRTFQGGRLKSFEDYGRELLPLAKKRDSCVTMERGSACFDAGDTRTNQIVTLVAIHTLFLREHNRIAKALEDLNPHWTDEDIFWEARNVLVAEIQVITYKEFLPCILGETTMDDFNLNLSGDYAYSFDYDPTIEPSITNEFSAAAYRFGHSMIDGTLKIYGKSKMDEVISLPEVMFQPARMRKWEFFDEILSTLTTEPIQKVDNFMSEALTRYLFKSGSPFGLDLAAINIQRGRDHGLRPYNDYRQLIGLPRMRGFEDFGYEIGSKLGQLYDTIDDVDLWVGGLLEPKESGSILGPTFRDIVADQFDRLKRGDRFFFENDPEVNPGHFTPAQLHELKKASMSRIICDNSDRIVLHRQAPNAFKKPDVSGNEFVDCDGPIIPRIDLSLWRD